MKLILQLAAVVALFASVQAHAASALLDWEPMTTCGGFVTLNEAANGDFAIQFKNMSSTCDHLRFYDVTSGRTIKEYDIKGTSYTLSKAMLGSLSDDCRVGFTVSNSYYASVKNSFNVISNSCLIARAASTPKLSYQLSEKGNCKRMANGQYTKLTTDDFCTGAITRADVVSFEFSNKGNCKRMVNGQFSNQLVSDLYCLAK